MFGIADYGAFVVTIIVFLLVPGPGNLAMITSTSKGGLRGGLAATLGLISGDQVLMWMAVAGVAALLASYPTAFHAAQWLGAAYLAGLAEGYWSSTSEVTDSWSVDARFVPAEDRADAEALYRRWAQAVERSRGWAES